MKYVLHEWILPRLTERELSIYLEMERQQSLIYNLSNHWPGYEAITRVFWWQQNNNWKGYDQFFYYYYYTVFYYYLLQTKKNTNLMLIKIEWKLFHHIQKTFSKWIIFKHYPNKRKKKAFKVRPRKLGRKNKDKTFQLWNNPKRL